MSNLLYVGTSQWTSRGTNYRQPCKFWNASVLVTWWCHQMETFSALLAFCEGKSNGHRWIPLTKASFAELWCFVFCLICASANGWAYNGDAGDFWRHRALYYVTLMKWHPRRIWLQPGYIPTHNKYKKAQIGRTFLRSIVLPEIIEKYRSFSAP